MWGEGGGVGRGRGCGEREGMWGEVNDKVYMRNMTMGEVCEWLIS